MLRLRSEIHHKSLLSALRPRSGLRRERRAASQRNQVESSKPCHSGQRFALSFDSLFCPGSPGPTSHREHSTGITSEHSRPWAGMPASGVGWRAVQLSRALFNRRTSGLSGHTRRYARWCEGKQIHATGQTGRLHHRSGQNEERLSYITAT